MSTPFQIGAKLDPHQLPAGTLGAFNARMAVNRIHWGGPQRWLLQ